MHVTLMLSQMYWWEIQQLILSQENNNNNNNDLGGGLELTKALNAGFRPAISYMQHPVW